MYLSIRKYDSHHTKQSHKLPENRDRLTAKNNEHTLFQKTSGYRSAAPILSTFSNATTNLTIEKDCEMTPTAVCIEPSSVQRFNNMADPSVAMIVRNRDKKERAMTIQERRTLYMHGWFSQLVKRRKILTIDRSKQKKKALRLPLCESIDDRDLMVIDHCDSCDNKEKHDNCDSNISETLECCVCSETICEKTLLVNPHQDFVEITSIGYAKQPISNCSVCMCIKCLLNHSFNCRGMQQLPSCPFCRQFFEESALVPFSVQYVT